MFQAVSVVRSIVSGLLVTVSLAVLSDAAKSAELVVGGYQGAPITSLSSRFDGPDLSRFHASEPQDDGTLSFDFTPRQSGSMFGAVTSRIPAKRLVIGSGVNDPAALRGDFTSVGLAEDDDAENRFSIGGALEFESFRVLGGYSRVDLMGRPSDIIAAGVDYGRITAKLGFGQTDDSESDSSDVVMFTTDLSALSWLTLESNVAFGSDERDESVTAGRIGLRLDF